MSFSRTTTLARTLRLNPAARICRQCLAPPASAAARPPPLLSRSLEPRASPLTRHLRPFSLASSLARSARTRPVGPAAQPQPQTHAQTQTALGNLAETLVRDGRAVPPAKGGPWFPETSPRVVGYWLLGSAGLVFAIVVLGGLTRLTESGLSITEWKPVTGALPPMSDADWEENFAKYRDSPEYRLLNPNMSLDEYKFIYYMEWSHRLLGRVIGLCFVLPAAYFVARRRVSARVARRLAGISLLIALQGGIGWWMVKSGLQDDLFAEAGAHPRVSQYRLTAHLGAAFAVYAAMLWSGLDVLREHRLLRDPAAARAEFAKLAHPRLRVFRATVGVLALLTFATAMTGGLVAGLDAGLIYNEFPWMGVSWHPPRHEMLDPFYAQRADGADLVWRNMLENPSTVQFDHRVMALTTFSAIVAAFVYSRRGTVAKLLPRKGKAGMMGVLHLAILQALLGIGTLVYMVPTPLAAAHQAGSLALLTGTIVLGSRVWLPRRAAAMVLRKISSPKEVSKMMKRAAHGKKKLSML